MPIHLNIVRRIMGGSPSEIRTRKRSTNPAAVLVKTTTLLTPSQHPQDYDDHHFSDLQRSESNVSTFEDNSCSSLHDDLPVQKKVQFANLEIREYKGVVGDHPCCTMGYPLSLGWEYSSCPSQSLESYEATRQPRRSREQLKTTRDERRQMLEEVTSETDLKRAERRLYRERSQNVKVLNRSNKQFFT